MKKKIKVLMPDIMKVEHNVRVLQEANSLKSSGYDVTIVGFSNRTKNRNFQVENIDVVSYYLDDTRDGLGKFKRIYSGLKMITAINIYILTHKADIYHAHNFPVLLACTLAAKFYRAKLIYDTHESWTIHRNKKYHPEHLFAFIVERLLLRFVDEFVTINEMVAEYYYEKYNLKNATILYNNRRLISLKKKDLIRERFNIDIHKKIAFFVGGLWPSGRGIFELIRSSQYLNGDCAIVFLGYGADRMLQSMRKEIDKVGGKDKVYIIPPVEPDKVMEYVMSADIGMNLIKRESRAQDFQSPWKLFEFCMGGLAVISTDLPFHRKVYDKYNIGVLCDTQNSPHSIAHCLNEIFSDEKKFQEYKIQARVAAEKEYNWENQEKKLINLYQNFD